MQTKNREVIEQYSARIVRRMHIHKQYGKHHTLIGNLSKGFPASESDLVIEAIEYLRKKGVLQTSRKYGGIASLDDRKNEVIKQILRQAERHEENAATDRQATKSEVATALELIKKNEQEVSTGAPKPVYYAADTKTMKALETSRTLVDFGRGIDKTPKEAYRIARRYVRFGYATEAYLIGLCRSEAAAAKVVSNQKPEQAPVEQETGQETKTEKGRKLNENKIGKLMLRRLRNAGLTPGEAAEYLKTSKRTIYRAWAKFHPNGEPWTLPVSRND